MKNSVKFSRKTFSYVFYCIVFLMKTTLPSAASENDFLLTIRNVAQTAPNLLEFDVYLLDSDPSQPFQLSTLQLGINFNLIILNGAVVSSSMTSIVPGYSQLPTEMQPINISTTDAGLIRLSPRNLPGAGNGYIVSSTSPGTLITRLRITNSIAFTTGSTPNMSFTSSSAVNPSYATRVGIYAGGSTNTFLVVTPNVNANVIQNPVLSVPEISNSVNGSLNGYYYQMNTPAASYQLSASNLTTDITIAASTTSSNPSECQIQVSLNPDFGFLSQLVLSPVNGFINTTIYVKPDCSIVPFTSSGTITHTSAGTSPDIINVWLENEYSYYYAPVVTIGQIEALPESIVFVPITGINYNSFGVAAYYIDFNPTELSFNGIENVNLDLPFWSVCSNCTSPYLCCFDQFYYLLYNVTNIDPTHSRLFIKIYQEVGHFSLPDGGKLFDLVFYYSGGISVLEFTDGYYYYSGNPPPNPPQIINEPFENYYINGYVIPQPDPPIITNSANGNIYEVFFQMTTPAVPYQVNAINLTDDLTILAATTGSNPAECQLEVSLSPNQEFSTQLIISPDNGSINTTIYVKPSCTVIPFSSMGSISQTSTGATPDIINVYLENEYSYYFAPIVTIGQVQAIPGTIAYIPVTATGFENFGVAEYYVDFNPTELSFNGIENVNPELPFWSVCSNCTSPYLCCFDEFHYLLYNVTSIDPTHSRLFIRIYQEVGQFSVPNGEKLFDMVFYYFGGSDDLVFSDGNYIYSGNGVPWDPEIINEPFEDYYINGSVSPMPFKTINLGLYLEGLYNPATGQMNKASGRNFPALIADEITVCITTAIFPYSIIFEQDSITLSQNGMCQVDIPESLDGDYYIIIKHRNSIETWSATPVSFAGPDMTYIFYSAINTAYGNNLMPTGSKYSLYGGDINQDGFVDTGDMSSLDNDASVFAGGYIPTDVNGDGIVDTGDMTIVDNNASSFTGVFFPAGFVPELTTNQVLEYTQYTANGGGNIINDHGLAVTLRGVCWNTTQNPTIFNNHTSDGQGSGSFLSNITALSPSTTYFVRAYAINEAGTAYGNQVSFTTTGFSCGTILTVNHVAGTVAPVTKTVNYGIAETNLSGTNKCWITQNLGADHQAATVTDATEASAGWYWQFNRKQGFKHDGSIRTPSTSWIATINENSDWSAANDPCTLLLGALWRIPTITEWQNADDTRGWNNYNDAFASVLKLHASGSLSFWNGILNSRGSSGIFWSSSTGTDTYGWRFSIGSSFCYTDYYEKSFGWSVRCLKD
jgi:hypothetical protein